MSVTIANIISNVDTYFGDTSTDRISQAERFQAITEAVTWCKETSGNDHENESYTIPYYDTVHKYKITTAIADLIDAVDLRLSEKDHHKPISREEPRDFWLDVGNNTYLTEYAIERKDSNAYFLMTHQSKYPAVKLSSFDSLTADGGTWEVDSTNSDATNLTIDESDYEEGTASFNFDFDVSQSANNTAIIHNTSLTTRDISEYENLASFVLRAKLPVVTNLTGLTIKVGSSTSNYITITVTTDILGNALAAGWGRFKFDWTSATTTGTPDFEDITYISLSVNYGAGQGDVTDVKFDELLLVRPENVEFNYLSWKLGTTNAGVDLFAFTATTDIPYFSGQYDQYKFPVAHMAAAILFDSLRLYDSASKEEQKAILALRRINNIIPSSRLTEKKQFKVAGVSFKRARRK